MRNNSSTPAGNRKALIPWAINGDHGFVAAPTVLIRNKGRLGLDDDELSLILAIMSHKWDDAAPWPSVEKLADYLGWSGRKVQRALRKLEGKHTSTKSRGSFLLITARKLGPKRNDTNLYDLTSLFTALAKLESVADKNGVVTQAEETSEDTPAANEPVEASKVSEAAKPTATVEPIPTRVEWSPEPNASSNPAMANKAASKFSGFGIPRYEQETSADDYEVIHAEPLARADGQAQEVWLREELEEFAARALTQYEIFNLPGYLRLRDAREQFLEEGISEVEAEALGQDRQDLLEHLFTDGPLLAWLGVPGYRERLHEHFPQVYTQVMS